MLCRTSASLWQLSIQPLGWHLGEKEPGKHQVAVFLMVRRLWHCNCKALTMKGTTRSVRLARNFNPLCRNSDYNMIKPVTPIYMHLLHVAAAEIFKVTHEIRFTSTNSCSIMKM